ncbi:hypothetical protein B0H14DRAFT_2726345 [Mycena olivaceomarginata]|nr:hypothetical protein B0H14DRAFT_2726345 [Mycena olivaceomarginata]
MPKVQCRRTPACLRCWEKKIRCDRAPSCEHCTRRNTQCTYPEANSRTRSSRSKKLQLLVDEQMPATMNPSLLNLDRRLRVVESALFGWTSPIEYGVSGPIPTIVPLDPGHLRKSLQYLLIRLSWYQAEWLDRQQFAESTFDWCQISHPFDYPDIVPDALAWRVIPSVQDNLECSEHSRG